MLVFMQGEMAGEVNHGVEGISNEVGSQGSGNSSTYRLKPRHAIMAVTHASYLKFTDG